MTRQRVLILLVLLALGTAAAYAWWRTRGNDEGLRLSGNVDIREVNLSFRVGGRLQRLSVDEGARVHAGEVLGELDAAPFRIALAQAQANRAALRAQQTLYHEGYRKEDIEQARANLQAAQAAQSNAERLYERQQQLAGTGASPRHVLDDARAQRDQAAAQTEAARQRLAELTRGFRKAEVEQVDASAQGAADQVAQAQLQLDDTRLIAPADGTILTRAVEPGSMLAPGGTVFTLSLDRPVWVRAYVDEPNLGRVAPGTHVKVYTDARRAPYDGVVGFVSPTAEFTPKNVETQDLRTALVYRLRVVVQDPDSALRQGMPVTVGLDGAR